MKNVLYKHISFSKVANPYGWLGNMSPYPIIYNGKEWRTSEALFQSMRFNNPDIIESIRLEKSPMSAKMKAKKHINEMVVQPISFKDIDNMKKCIDLKLEQHLVLRDELLATGDCIIYEDVASRPRGRNLFWGAYYDSDLNTLVGENMLGKIWMEARSKL
jgi:ribA/ribD-fused uncharacterized protein